MMRNKSKVQCSAAARIAAAVVCFLAVDAMAADVNQGPVQNHAIGYAASSLKWATYETPGGKFECPNGLNLLGPREQFKARFPDGTKRTEVDTHLKFEIDAWYPNTTPDSFVFHEAQGPTALGLNLDGKIGPNDFTSPTGEKGIDNQLYRAIGCIPSYRGADGYSVFYPDKHIVTDRYNRLMIEISGIDNLTNDPDVDVTFYRGMDKLLTDATGQKIMPGGSQRIDMRWGKKYIQHIHGKIVDGVLTTEPHDLVFPWDTFGVPTDEIIRGMRLKLKLTTTGAEGMMAGYSDIDAWYFELTRSESTHHRSYGQLSAPSLYKVMRRLADGYPDAKTGENTAISSALLIKFAQVFILHENAATSGGSIVNESVRRSNSMSTSRR